MNNLLLELSEKELRNIYGGEKKESTNQSKEQNKEEGEIIKYWINREDGIYVGWEHR